MVKRQCPKCKVIFNRKSHYDYHINRKNECVPNVEISDENNDVFQNFPNSSKIYPNLSKFIQNFPNTNLTNLDIAKNDEETNITNPNLNCSFCLKSYSSKGNLVKHLKICKVKKENDDEKEQIFKLLLEKDKQHKEELYHHREEIKLHKEEVNELKKQNKLLIDKIDKLIKTTSKAVKVNKMTTSNDNSITNHTNHTNQTNQTNQMNSNNTITNNQTNNTQNIVMVNFGKEDLSIIDEKQFIDRIVKQNKISGVKIPDEVLKIIHFNPQYPQLSNIYISDINREKCMVYEDGEWKLSSINNIPQIMDKVCVFSAGQINNLRTKHPDNKPLHERLGVIEKYNNMIDGDYVEDLRDEGKQVEIARCEEFQSHAYNTLKKTLYNEGKKLKKTIKLK